MTNRMGSPRTVTLSVSCSSFYLTGITARKVKQERQIIVLQPYQSKSFFKLFKYLKCKSVLRRFMLKHLKRPKIDVINKNFDGN